MQTQESIERKGNAQGAAIRIVRADLLASQLSKQQATETDQPPYRLMVGVFRTQEQVYRVITLFQQSGEYTQSLPESVFCSPWADNMPSKH